jgi:hypothetical protein
MSRQRFSSQKIQNHRRDIHELLSGLVLEAQHNQSRVLIGWVNADIGKAQIEREERAAFGPAFIKDVAITPPAKSFIPDGYGVVAVLAEELRQVRVEILVHFELH